MGVVVVIKTYCIVWNILGIETELAECTNKEDAEKLLKLLLRGKEDNTLRIVEAKVLENWDEIQSMLSEIEKEHGIKFEVIE